MKIICFFLYIHNKIKKLNESNVKMNKMLIFKI